MTRRLPFALLGLCFAADGLSQDIVKRVGQATIAVDTSHAHPGGVVAVRLSSRRSLGLAYAILQGFRAPFFPGSRGPRALVPVPVTARPGAAALGVEILTRRSRQRIPVDITLGPREYGAATVVVPPQKRPLLGAPDGLRDGRRLLARLRTETPLAAWLGPFRPPVAAPAADSFGVAETYVGGSPVERMMDALFGEYHRGLDYPVPPGTIVQAPAAGTVVMAEPLTLTGQTLVIDHGQGVVSALYHLGRLDVREGDRIEGRAPVGLSGDSGLAASPHVHWGVYLHGVAVDPRIFESLSD